MDNRILMAATLITDTQIERLRGEAATAGDMLQVYVCSVALGVKITVREIIEELCLSSEQRVRVLAMTPTQARAECARVIADAKARASDG